MAARFVEVARATARRYVDDGMPERAPGIAYYGVLSLFPMLLIGFAILRFLGGDDAAQRLAEFAHDEGASGTVADTLRSAATTARSASSATAGTAGLVGAVTLLYGASRAFTAFGRAVDVTEGRTSARRSPARRAEDLGWTLVLVVMGLVALVLAILSGRLLAGLADHLSLGHEEVVWRLVRWPAAVVLAVLGVAVLRWAAPTGARRRFRLLTAGSVFTAAALTLGTRGFDLYVSNIATYNDTYGAFTGGVILLLWIWLSASIALLGAELDAELREARDARPTPGRRWAGWPNRPESGTVDGDQHARSGS